MKPKITFADIIKMCKVYTENQATTAIPANIGCDIYYNPDQSNVVTFSFARNSKPVAKATLSIIESECPDDEADKLVMVIIPSSHETIRLEIPIDIEFDSYRRVSANFYESNHVVYCLDTWEEIIHKLRVWYYEFNVDPDIAIKTYKAVTQITPEIIQSLIAHNVITQEQGNTIQTKIEEIKSGRVWPNIDHKIQ